MELIFTRLHKAFAVATALCCLASTTWQALAAQNAPPPSSPDNISPEPVINPRVTPPALPPQQQPYVPPALPPQQQPYVPPSAPPLRQVPSVPPPSQAQQAYHQQQQQTGNADQANVPYYGSQQDVQQQQPAYYGGDPRYEPQQPPSYNPAVPSYQNHAHQGYQPPPAYQQQHPPVYNEESQPQYAQARAGFQQQQQVAPPPQQEYYQPPSALPSQQQQYQQQQQQPYQVPLPQRQQDPIPQPVPQQKQQQVANGTENQGGDTNQAQQAKQQPTQQRQQPARAEHQVPVAQKQQMQQERPMSVPPVLLEDDVTSQDGSDEMMPEYQPRREEEGGIVDSDQQTASLMEEWEKHMQNFIPDMLVTFSLGARSDEYFYESVDEDPVFLRGGFFVGGEEGDGAVDFSITNPDGDVIYKKSRSEGLFYFTADKKGTYSFILSNHRWMESKMVTFAIGRGVETALLPKHLNNAEEMANQLERQLRDIQAESSYLWIRQRSLNDAAQGFLQRLSWLSGIEFLILIATAAFHARYIVGLVSDKRIL